VDNALQYHEDVEPKDPDEREEDDPDDDEREQEYDGEHYD